MAANFLHGVETIQIDTGPRPINTVKSAVIGLVGTAPQGALNTPTVVLSDRQAADFGPALPGFTIPQALDAIFDQGAGTVIVINVLDPTTHKTSVTAEAVTLDSTTDKVKVAHAALQSATVKNTGGTVTYTLDEDYSIDLLNGEITRLPDGDITVGQALSVDYVYSDPTKVLAADVIGTLSVGGIRSGLQALLDTYNTLGFNAKVLIAPGYCTQNSVATEMIAKATKLRGVALIDAPIGTTPAQAIAGRGPNGAINFNTSSDRAVLCYPHLKVYDVATDSERLEPFSQRLAGVITNKDIERGYWWSPSNTEILGITGVERKLSAQINDPQSEVNALNEVGITTLFNSFGSGIRSWGNRSAAFPTNTHPRNFICVRRTADILHESIEYAMLQFIDYPINDALIDSIKESVNAFIRTLVGRGALIDGNCTFDKTKNPNTEIAAGHLTFDIAFMPPTPAERITFESFIDISLLKNLGV